MSRERSQAGWFQDANTLIIVERSCYTIATKKLENGFRKRRDLYFRRTSKLIKFFHNTTNIDASMLEGFFVGWPSPPTSKTLLDILRNAYVCELALEKKSGRVVGFIYAISDGILSAYIPLLEVLPEFQNRGIGRELVQKLIERLQELYMIDLCCDENLRSFYAPLKLEEFTGFGIRNYRKQSGFDNKN